MVMESKKINLPACMLNIGGISNLTLVHGMNNNEFLNGIGHNFEIDNKKHTKIGLIFYTESAKKKFLVSRETQDWQTKISQSCSACC